MYYKCQKNESCFYKDYVDDPRNARKCSILKSIDVVYHFNRLKEEKLQHLTLIHGFKKSLELELKV